MVWKAEGVIGDQLPHGPLGQSGTTGSGSVDQMSGSTAAHARVTEDVSGAPTIGAATTAGTGARISTGSGANVETGPGANVRRFQGETLGLRSIDLRLSRMPSHSVVRLQPHLRSLLLRHSSHRISSYRGRQLLNNNLLYNNLLCSSRFCSRMNPRYIKVLPDSYLNHNRPLRLLLRILRWHPRGWDSGIKGPIWPRGQPWSRRFKQGRQGWLLEIQRMSRVP